jgi:hypothetical protein
MKQRFRLSIVPIVVMVVVIGCSPPAPKSVAPEPTDGLNLLVAVEGQVRLKRDGWSDYIPVGFGTLIQYDDLLQVDGIATVLCGDLTVETVSGWDSCPCPPSARGRLEHRGTYFRGPSANVRVTRWSWTNGLCCAGTTPGPALTPLPSCKVGKRYGNRTMWQEARCSIRRMRRLCDQMWTTCWRYRTATQALGRVRIRRAGSGSR